jgi:hypothetical protein
MYWLAPNFGHALALGMRWLWACAGFGHALALGMR